MQQAVGSELDTRLFSRLPVPGVIQLQHETLNPWSPWLSGEARQDGDGIFHLLQYLAALRAEEEEVVEEPEAQGTFSPPFCTCK